MPIITNYGETIALNNPSLLERVIKLFKPSVPSPSDAYLHNLINLHRESRSLTFKGNYKGAIDIINSFEFKDCGFDMKAQYLETANRNLKQCMKNRHPLNFC